MRTPGSSNGTPVLAGDFFQVDENNNSATGDELARRSDICREVSTRSLDFGAGTHFTVYITSPRGTNTNVDPPSFTVQVYDEPGNSVGAPQPVWTSDNSLELEASDFTGIPFGSLRFDFTNSLGGTVYSEYSAFGRFSVGLGSQCHGAPSCDKDCCPPGALKATVGGLHYTQIPDCAMRSRMRSRASSPSTTETPAKRPTGVPCRTRSWERRSPAARRTIPDSRGAR